MSYPRESMDSREGFDLDFSEPTEAECLAEEQDYEEMRATFEWMDEQDQLDRDEEEREYQAWVESDDNIDYNEENDCIDDIWDYFS